jgi:hypothetical protein
MGPLAPEFMEVRDPFGPEFGAGDCVDRSPVLSIEPPLGAEVTPEVPSEVWIFRLACGKADPVAGAAGAFRLRLNKNAMRTDLSRSKDYLRYGKRSFSSS